MKKVYVIKVYEKGYDKGIRLVYDMDKDVTGFSCTWHPTWIIQRLREYLMETNQERKVKR